MTYTQTENLKTKLTRYNKEQFEEFCLYLSSSDLDANKRNEIRDEILDHLLEGEKQGKDFQDLFGQNPRDYTKQLVEQLPKSSIKEKLTFIFSVIVISVITILSSSNSNSYLFIDVILFSILNGLVVFGFLKLTKRFAFKNSILSLLILTLIIQIAGISYYVLKNNFTEFF